MKPEKIPLDLSIFDDATIPKLTASDVYRLLGTKVMRGRFICRSLFFALAIGSGVAVIFRQVPASVAAIVLAVVFGTCAYVMERKLALARQISVEPSLVYWAHPTILRQHVAGRTIDINFITLHARTGWSFEVGMSHSDMLAVVAWLRSYNPDIRLGAYDNPTATANE
ncbi:hypothetical protein ACXR0O_09595 [Verrucomicrobiota bacterium sgz303538]